MISALFVTAPRKVAMALNVSRSIMAELLFG